jgi:hypothetical protein
MPTTSPEITERFNRSRRNLLLISLLLLFSQFAGGLTLKEINVFGNRTELGNPIEIETLLWVGLLYFLWRYYQYFHYSDDKSRIVGTFYGRRKVYLNAILEKLPELIKNIKDSYSKGAGGGESVKGLHIDNIEILKQSWLCTLVQVQEVGIKYKDGAMGHQLGPNKHTIKGSDLIVPNIRSIFYVIFRTPLFTEYYLPFVLAAIPFCVELYHLLNLL